MEKLVQTFFASIIALAFSAKAQATPLVSDEAIKLQIAQTATHKLKNGIPVIIRNIPDSDVVQLNVSFASGLKDLPTGRKALAEWLWGTATLGAKGYSKEKIFEIIEKYSLSLGCSGGIELSLCGVGTINEYWDPALSLFTAIVTAPSFAEADAKLIKERLTARLRAVPSDPNTYANEVVNSVFYPAGHPYRLNHDEALDELAKLVRPDLVQEHKNLLNAELMTIVVVGSMPTKKVLADLERSFGSIKRSKVTKKEVPLPKFSLKESYKFVDRAIPTAYIRGKLLAPGETSKDAAATDLLYDILSEDLYEEIRTKRSLSYSVGSFALQYSMGIGVLNASTSNPKETLAAMNEVIQKLKTRTFSDAELLEYKNTFATEYFLTQETHASLAAAIAGSQHYHGTPNALYEMPRQLEKVTPQDIKRLANEVLGDIRLGVVFDRKSFQDEWALDFIKKNAIQTK